MFSATGRSWFESVVQRNFRFVFAATRADASAWPPCSRSRSRRGRPARRGSAGCRSGPYLAVDGLDGDHQASRRCTRARRPPPPAVVAAGRDAQHLAHQPDRPASAMGLDEAVSHDDSLAKKAVAFFKISRSIEEPLVLGAEAAQLLLQGGRVAVTGEGPRRHRRRAASFQDRSRLSPRSRSRATSATLLPCSVTSLTAWTLNSGVNVRRVSPLWASSRRAYALIWCSPFVGKSNGFLMFDRRGTILNTCALAMPRPPASVNSCPTGPACGSCASTSGRIPASSRCSTSPATSWSNRSRSTLAVRCSR